MAIAKVILNGETLMDVTSDTVESDKLLSGETATKNDGTKITGSYSANLVPLTVISNNDEEQVFDGSPILTEINRAMFETSEISSGDSNTLTSNLDWIETGGNVSVVIGNRYRLSGWFGTGDTNETAQRIVFDTDWVASSDLISIPFTTKPGYSDDESGSFDGSIEFIEIKLSITQMTITATAPFVVFTDYNNESGMYLSVSEIGEALDGYVPVIVEPIKLISADIDLITDNNISSRNYAIDHLAIYESTAIITCTSVSDWNNFNEPILENCVIGNKYLIRFIIYNSTEQYVHGYSSNKSYKYDGTSFVVDLVNREGDWYGTITIENTRFKINSTRISDGDIIKYFTISDYIDGFNFVTVSNTALQSKTVSPSGSSQIVTADSGYYGLSQVTIEPAVSQLTYGTFTITANNTTTEANIGYLSMCSFAGSTTTYHPAYVATKVSGGTNIAYLGRWIINPSDGYMYVTFVGTNDTYTPNITATSGTSTLVTSKLSGGTIEDKGHFSKSMRVYKISDGAVLTASYVNNN